MQTIDITSHLKILGIAQPAGLALAGDIRRAINITANVSPVADLAADLLAGKVTPKQATARVTDAARALTEREHARVVARDLERTLVKVEQRALRDAGPDLIDAMRPHFDQAVATVVDATEMLGPNPDAAQVGQLGPAAAVHYEQRKAAAKRLAAVRFIVMALADAGFGNRQATVATYLATVPTADALREATQIGRGNDAITRLAANGYPMRLNTPDETAQLEAGARLATEEADQAERDATLAESKARTARYIQNWTDRIRIPTGSGERHPGLK